MYIIPNIYTMKLRAEPYIPLSASCGFSYTITSSMKTKDGVIFWQFHQSFVRFFDGPGFNSRSERCIYRASRPSQGTVNGDAVSK